MAGGWEVSQFAAQRVRHIFQSDNWKFDGDNKVQDCEHEEVFRA